MQLNCWEKIRHSKIYIFLLLWLGGSFAGMNANLFNVVLPDVLGAFSQNTIMIHQWGSWILSAFLFGWMCGGLFMGLIADRFGRVLACAFSIILYSAFTGLSAYAESPYTLLFYRLMVGIGVGGEMLSISILLAENFEDKGRALAIGALITSYQMGVFFSGLIVSLAGNWHTAFEWGTLPVLLAFIFAFTLPESPQWLKSKKQMLLNKTTSLFEQAPKKSLLTGAVVFGGFLIGYWAALSWVPTWIQSLSERALSGNEKQVATMIHGSLAVFGCSIAGLAVNRWGRPRVICCVLCLASLLSLLMFNTNDHFSWWIYAEYGCLGWLIGITQAALYIYLPELFSTACRGCAVGFCLNAGRLFTVCAVLFVGILVKLLGGYKMALSLFSIIYLIGPLMLWRAADVKLKVEVAS